MNWLAKIADEHPTATGAVGTGGGFFSWLISHLSTVQTTLAILGQILGVIVACLTATLLAWRILDRWRERRRPFIRRHHDDDELP